MKIEFKAHNGRIAKAYFREDYEEKNGEKEYFYMVITPLEEKSYYIRRDEDGIHITGEGWIIKDRKEALEFIAMKRLEIDDVKSLEFIEIDKEGNLKCSGSAKPFGTRSCKATGVLKLENFKHIHKTRF